MTSFFRLFCILFLFSTSAIMYCLHSTIHDIKDLVKVFQNYGVLLCMFVTLTCIFYFSCNRYMSFTNSLKSIVKMVLANTSHELLKRNSNWPSKIFRVVLCFLPIILLAQNIEFTSLVDTILLVMLGTTFSILLVSEGLKLDGTILRTLRKSCINIYLGMCSFLMICRSWNLCIDVFIFGIIFSTWRIILLKLKLSDRILNSIYSNSSSFENLHNNKTQCLDLEHSEVKPDKIFQLMESDPDAAPLEQTKLNEDILAIFKHDELDEIPNTEFNLMEVCSSPVPLVQTKLDEQILQTFFKRQLNEGQNDLKQEKLDHEGNVYISTVKDEDKIQKDSENIPLDQEKRSLMVPEVFSISKEQDDFYFSQNKLFGSKFKVDEKELLNSKCCPEILSEDNLLTQKLRINCTNVPLYQEHDIDENSKNPNVEQKPVELEDEKFIGQNKKGNSQSLERYCSQRFQLVSWSDDNFKDEIDAQKLAEFVFVKEPTETLKSNLEYFEGTNQCRDLKSGTEYQQENQTDVREQLSLNNQRLKRRNSVGELIQFFESASKKPRVQHLSMRKNSVSNNEHQNEFFRISEQDNEIVQEIKSGGKNASNTYSITYNKGIDCEVSNYKNLDICDLEYIALPKEHCSKLNEHSFHFVTQLEKKSNNVLNYLTDFKFKSYEEITLHGITFDSTKNIAVTDHSKERTYEDDVLFPTYQNKRNALEFEFCKVSASSCQNTRVDDNEKIPFQVKSSEMCALSSQNRIYFNEQTLLEVKSSKILDQSCQDHEFNQQTGIEIASYKMSDMSDQSYQNHNISSNQRTETEVESSKIPDQSWQDDKINQQTVAEVESGRISDQSFQDHKIDQQILTEAASCKKSDQSCQNHKIRSNYQIVTEVESGVMHDLCGHNNKTNSRKPPALQLGSYDDVKEYFLTNKIAGSSKIALKLLKVSDKQECVKEKSNSSKSISYVDNVVNEIDSRFIYSVY